MKRLIKHIIDILAEAKAEITKYRTSNKLQGR
jgi:hypothetical protein